MTWPLLLCAGCQPRGTCRAHEAPCILTFEHRVLQPLCHLMALLLIAGAGEAVLGLGELPLQSFQALLLLFSLPLGLLFYPFCHTTQSGERDRTVCLHCVYVYIKSLGQASGLSFVISHSPRKGAVFTISISDRHSKTQKVTKLC